MNIKNLISDMLNSISEEESVLRYVYNKKFIPNETPVYYSGPYWDSRELVEAINTFITGKWLSSGENVHKFESEFCKRFNQKYAVMVNSGSSANLVMLASLKKYFGWNDGDEIIVSPVGFPTTIAPITQNVLKPIFIDIELDTLNFDINQIESKITKKTVAIFISPVLGNPPDMDRLVELSIKHNISLIMDGCDSLGSTWDGKLLSDYCVATSYSFYPAHHISTGEGGMVTSNIKQIIDYSRSFSWWGRDCYCVGSANLLGCGTCGNRFDKWLDSYSGIVDHKYVFSNMGYNLKPMDLQGSIGLVQLSKFDEISNKKKNSYSRIREILSNIKGITFPSKFDKANPCWFGTPVICNSKEQKQGLVANLESKKIQTRNYFAGNILLHEGYKHLGVYSDFPNANTVLDTVFFLGASPHYNEDIFIYIEKVILEYEVSNSNNRV